MTIWIAHVTYEVTAYGEDEEEARRNALSAVRQWRGTAIHVEVMDPQPSPPPARQADSNQPAGA